MKKLLYTLLLLLFAQGAISQNTFFIGDKTYPSSDVYKLGKIEIVFVKNGEKGMIAVTVKVLGKYRIKENLKIYLEDYTIITCFDRELFDVVNNEATTIYYLTKQEIEKLKKANISKIRYRAGCYNCQNRSIKPSGDFSEKNTNYLDDKIDFPSIIKNLFK